MISRKKRSEVWKISKVDLQKMLYEKDSFTSILVYFGIKNKGGNVNTLKRRIKEENLDDSLLIKKRLSNNKIRLSTLSNNDKKPLEDILCENSTFTRYHLKQRLIEEEIFEYKCSECGITEWNGKTISLQLDHINGVSDDNRLENLRLLCPNCHSQTDTFSGKRNKKINLCEDCGVEINKDSNFCKTCFGKVNSKIQRKFEVSKEELEKLIKENTYEKIGEMFDVSGNAIKKRAKKLGIDISKDRRKFKNRYAIPRLGTMDSKPI